MDQSDFSTQIRDARWFLRSDAPEVDEVAVIAGGRDDCLPDYVMDRPQGFAHTGVEYVVSGRGLLTLAGQTTVLSAGSLFSYGPGIGHRIASDPTHPLVKYFMDFTGRGVPAFLDRNRIFPGTHARVGAASQVSQLFELFITDGLREGPQAARSTRLLAEVALLAAIRDRLPEGSGDHGRRHEAFLRCRDHILHHYLTLSSAKRAAEVCGYSQEHLSRLFRDFSPGESAPELIVRLRISHAAALLADPRMLVKQAGAMVGYDDPSHFIRVFRRVMGRAPGAGR